MEIQGRAHQKFEEITKVYKEMEMEMEEMIISFSNLTDTILFRPITAKDSKLKVDQKEKEKNKLLLTQTPQPPKGQITNQK